MQTHKHILPENALVIIKGNNGNLNIEGLHSDAPKFKTAVDTDL